MRSTHTFYGHIHLAEHILSSSFTLDIKTNNEVHNNSSAMSSGRFALLTRLWLSKLIIDNINWSLTLFSRILNKTFSCLPFCPQVVHQNALLMYHSQQKLSRAQNLSWISPTKQENILLHISFIRFLDTRSESAINCLISEYIHTECI